MRFHRLGFPWRKRQQSLSALGRWGCKENRKDIAQSIRSKTFFITLIFEGHNITCIVMLSEKKKEMELGLQQRGEMKSPAVMMMIRLPLVNMTASGCLANQSLDFVVRSVK